MTCYAAICLALHEEFGFGRKRLLRVLERVDEKTMYAMDHTEVTDEVFAKLGMKMEFSDPFNRIRAE